MDQKQAELNRNLAQMLKGGVIMDVTTPEQAKIAAETRARDRRVLPFPSGSSGPAIGLRPRPCPAVLFLHHSACGGRPPGADDELAAAAQPRGF